MTSTCDCEHQARVDDFERPQTFHEALAFQSDMLQAPEHLKPALAGVGKRLSDDLLRAPSCLLCAANVV